MGNEANVALIGVYAFSLQKKTLCLAFSSPESSYGHLAEINQRLLTARGRLCSWCWGYVRAKHPDLPIIALTNHRPVSLDLGRTEVFSFNSCTPCSGRPHLFAVRTYYVRRIL